MKTFLFLFLTALTALATPKSKCTAAHISLERLGPVRDQGIAGLCFAFEGADLITYKLNQRVSALDLGIAYFKNSRLQKMTRIYQSGGVTETALASALRIGGVCSEDWIPSNESFGDSGPQIYEAFAWLETNDWALPETVDIIRAIFPMASDEVIARALNLPNFKKRILYLQKNACGERLRFSHLQLQYFPTETSAENLGLIEKINQQLDQNNIVGIGFYSNDLYVRQEKSGDDGHATTLVGRRWNEVKHTCEYRMRDNFGAQCDAYPETFDCDGGYIWVDEAFLLKNLFEVEYF